MWGKTLLPSGLYCLAEGKDQYHVAEAEALKFGPELTLPLSVVFLSLQWDPVLEDGSAETSGTHAQSSNMLPM